MPNVTVQELVDDIRIMSGLRNNQFYTDTQIASFVDDAAKEYYDKFVLSNQHYFIKTFDFTLSSGNSRVKLPLDFMKQNVLVMNPGEQEVFIDAMENYQSTGQATDPVAPGLGGPRFFISGDYLSLYPAQSSAGSYQLRYTPMIEDLTLGESFPMTITPTIVARLMSNEPLDPLGSWASTSGGNGLLLTIASPFTQVRIDGKVIAVADIIIFQGGDAPINGLQAGAWEVDSITDVGPGTSLEVNFTRDAGTPSLEVGDTWSYLDILSVTDGDTYEGTYWATSGDDWLIGGAPEGLRPLNGMRTGLDNRLVLQNADLNGSYVGGTVSIEGALEDENNGIFDIAAFNHDFANAVNLDASRVFVDEGFPSTAVVTFSKPGTRGTVPQTLTPWVLYLKVHASIAVREGRQQDCIDLQSKLAKQEQRIAAIAVNRTERVVQAPLSRCRTYGYGGDGL